MSALSSKSDPPLAFKRWPAPTIGLAAVSVTTTVVATITHPLAGYETETVVWARYLREGLFQPTIATAYGLGRGWGGIWPFLLAACGAVALAAWATPRMRLPVAALGAGALAVLAWALFAWFAPTLLGIDHQGLLDIQAAGDRTALHKGFGSYPLKTLAPLAAAVGLLALAGARLLRSGPDDRSGRPPRRRSRARGTRTAVTACSRSRPSAQPPPRPCRPLTPPPPAHAPPARGAGTRDRHRMPPPARRLGPLRLAAHRKRLNVLATGDSMIYPIDQELAVDPPRGMRVQADRRDGTGLTTATVNWHRLAQLQVARFHPGATVISLGGRDGGYPLRAANHQLVECCGASWLALYAQLAQPLVDAYVQGGRAHVYWLLLPAPREAARAPLYEAVNNAIRLLASRFPADMTLIRSTPSSHLAAFRKRSPSTAFRSDRGRPMGFTSITRARASSKAWSPKR